MFNVRNVGKTLVTRTQGTKVRASPPGPHPPPSSSGVHALRPHACVRKGLPSAQEPFRARLRRPAYVKSVRSPPPHLAPRLLLRRRLPRTASRAAWWRCLWPTCRT